MKITLWLIKKLTLDELKECLKITHPSVHLRRNPKRLSKEQEILRKIE